MKIAITGATGLIGSALVPRLWAENHQIVRLVRSAPQPGQVYWNPEKGELDAASLEGIDACIHLAGETIAGLRWTKAKKGRILESRVKGTRLLAETLAKIQRPPRVMLCASAIGFYGDRGDELLTEESAMGGGFLAEVVQAWEGAGGPAKGKTRGVNLRIGIVVSRDGGALKPLLPLFKLGLGGRVGSGRQYWSWVSLDDVVNAFLFALANERLQGPVNVTAPNPVTNAAFAKALGRVLSRPAIVWTPGLLMRLLLGEAAKELILSGARVTPAKLLANGYAFAHTDLEPALRDILKKPAKGR